MGCCEHYETTGFIRGGKFVNKPKEKYQFFFFKNDILRNWLINITLHIDIHAYKYKILALMLHSVGTAFICVIPFQKVRPKNALFLFPVYFE
jgi:hypothetical protein